MNIVTMNIVTPKHSSRYNIERAQSSWMWRLERLFREYALVVLFALLCYGLYYRVHIQTKDDLRVLKQMHSHLLRDRQMAYQTKTQLTLHWQSGADPYWRQLLLMREMGLVPKGFKKIVFTPSSPPPPKSSSPPKHANLTPT